MISVNLAQNILCLIHDVDLYMSIYGNDIFKGVYLLNLVNFSG